MSALENVLSRLNRVRKCGNGYEAQCPAHDDGENSLTVGEGSDEKVLLRCHKGCSTEEIVAELGLKMSDLFPDRGGIGYTPVSDATVPPAGLTVEAYAKAKGLPVEFLTRSRSSLSICGNH